MPYQKKPFRERALGELRNFVTVFAVPIVGYGLFEAGQTIQPGSGGVGYTAAIWVGLGGVYIDVVRPRWRKRQNRERPGHQRQYFWRDMKFLLFWPYYGARNLLGVEHSPF